MADAPLNELERVDRLEYLLAREKLVSADQVLTSTRLQLVLAQSEVTQRAQALGGAVEAIRTKYALGPQDKFDPETGKITRVLALHPEKTADGAQLDESANKRTETALPGV